MNNHNELFRIFVNFANTTRDLEDERQLINRLATCVLDLIEPLTLKHRTHLSLDLCQKTFKQWLIVSTSSDLQFSLFKESDGVGNTWRHVDDRAGQAASERMLQSVRMLRELSEQARWNPTDFFEAISQYKSSDVLILTTLRDRQFEIQAANGQSVVINSLELPRRTYIADPVEIQFILSSIGNEHACIELLREYRRLLKTQYRLITLSWTSFEFPNLTDLLYPRLRSKSLVTARVNRLVDPQGITKSFSLDELIG